MTLHTFNFKRLKNWFLEEKRDLPWRNHLTPYSIWISEVMLQQTQVAVVIPYYERWMTRFPTIEALAQASLDEVIKCWEGLGYYSRARSLHEGAKYVMQHHQGILPSSAEELKSIKGLGPYTIGAILSFAFKQKVAAVDGNVIRVLTRYFEIEDDTAKNKTINYIRNIAQEILPEDESWIQNEALIELGATVCKKKPKCIECPLRIGCKGYINGSAERLPYKSTKTETFYLYRSVPIIENAGKFLIRRGKQGQIMHDLHEFPYFETSSSGWTAQRLQEEISKAWNLTIRLIHEMSPVNHSFTKYQVRLNPVFFKTENVIHVEDHVWLSSEEINRLAFSSGHRRVLANLQEFLNL